MANLDKKLLEGTVSKILSNNKGIFAADESPGTVEKRFAGRMENTIENRHLMRKVFFETSGFKNYIGGVILHDETIRSKETIKVLVDNQIVLGIKTDKGLAPLVGGKEGEQTTNGLDTLAVRSAEYFTLGARFAKWRSVILIGDGTPTEESYKDVSTVLAKYAIITQQAGMVPIVEPEVLPNGTHTIEKCKEVTEKIIKMTLNACKELGVHMPGCLLKVNMVTKGQALDIKLPVRTVAEHTVDSLVNGTKGHDLGGVVFLSGGLSEIDSALYLNEINKVKTEKKVLQKIPVHFSFARALQGSAITLHCEKNAPETVQKCIAHRCKMCHLATKGEYKQELEGEYTKTSQNSNFVANNNY